MSKVFRGQESWSEEPKSLWVTRNAEYAKEYGEIKEYELPDNLNILDATYNKSEWDSMCCEFEGDEYDEDDYYDFDEYMFEPPHEFVNFLQSKGYAGFEHETRSGDNILIFDKSILK